MQSVSENDIGCIFITLDGLACGGSLTVLDSSSTGLGFYAETVNKRFTSGKRSQTFFTRLDFASLMAVVSFPEQFSRAKHQQANKRGITIKRVNLFALTICTSSFPTTTSISESEVLLDDSAPLVYSVSSSLADLDFFLRGRERFFDFSDWTGAPNSFSSSDSMAAVSLLCFPKRLGRVDDEASNLVRQIYCRSRTQYLGKIYHQM